MILINLDDGPQEMPWTLGSHIQLSNVKYPPRQNTIVSKKVICI